MPKLRWSSRQNPPPNQSYPCAVLTRPSENDTDFPCARSHRFREQFTRGVAAGSSLTDACHPSFPNSRASLPEKMYGISRIPSPLRPFTRPLLPPSPPAHSKNVWYFTQLHPRRSSNFPKMYGISRSLPPRGILDPGPAFPSHPLARSFQRSASLSDESIRISRWR